MDRHFVRTIIIGHLTLPPNV